ncbi:hypothetical protein E4U41_005174 [Claviceps citrina]|nr:hypothetical protein E4U41_005174 [Claviceps citrina]
MVRTSLDTAPGVRAISELHHRGATAAASVDSKGICEGFRDCRRLKKSAMPSAMPSAKSPLVIAVGKVSWSRRTGKQPPQIPAYFLPAVPDGARIKGKRRQAAARIEPNTRASTSLMTSTYY